jgi:hypothetical protein
VKHIIVVGFKLIEINSYSVIHNGMHVGDLW